jgi:hypothetical protein
MIPSSREAEVPELLVNDLKTLLSSRTHLKEMGNHAKAWAAEQNFSDTASKLAQLIASVG